MAYFWNVLCMEWELKLWTENYGLKLWKEGTDCIQKSTFDFCLSAWSSPLQPHELSHLHMLGHLLRCLRSNSGIILIHPILILQINFILKSC